MWLTNEKEIHVIPSISPIRLDRVILDSHRLFQNLKVGRSSIIKTEIMSDTLFILAIMSDYWMLTTVDSALNLFAVGCRKAVSPTLRRLLGLNVKILNIEEKHDLSSPSICILDEITWERVWRMSFICLI